MIQKFFKSAHEDFLKRYSTQRYIKHGEVIDQRQNEIEQGKMCEEMDIAQRLEKLNSMRKTISDHIIERLNNNSVIEKYKDHRAFKYKKVEAYCIDEVDEIFRNHHEDLKAFDDAHGPTSFIALILGKVGTMAITDAEDYIMIGRETQTRSGVDNILIEITFKDYYTLFFVVDPFQTFDNPDNIVGALNVDEGEVKLGDLIDGIIESMENRIKINIGFNYEQEERVRLIERNSKHNS